MLESPYSGNVERNLIYARLCLKHSLSLGEAPIATHLLYTQVWDDIVPELREKAFERIEELYNLCSRGVFYTDLGVSRGMQAAVRLARVRVYRQLSESNAPMLEFDSELNARIPEGQPRADRLYLRIGFETCVKLNICLPLP